MVVWICFTWSTTHFVKENFWPPILLLPPANESTPVCAKLSYWRRRDDGEFIHEFTWKWTAYVE